MKTIKLLFVACAAMMFGTVARAATGDVLPATIGPAAVGEAFSQTFSVEGVDASQFKSVTILNAKSEVTSSSSYDASGDWSTAAAGETVPLPFICFFGGIPQDMSARLAADRISVGGFTINFRPMIKNPNNGVLISADLALDDGSVRYRSDSSSAKFLYQGTMSFSGSSHRLDCLVTLYPDGRVTLAYDKTDGAFVGGGAPSIMANSKTISYSGDSVELKDLSGDIAFTPLNTPTSYVFDTSTSTFRWTPTAVGTYEFGISFSTRMRPVQNYARYYALEVQNVKPSPKATITAASPTPFNCSTPELSLYNVLTLADKESQKFSVTVDSSASPLVYNWIDGVDGKPLPGADTSSSSYGYTHAASSGTKTIACLIADGVVSSADDALCSVVWTVKTATSDPPETPDPPKATITAALPMPTECTTKALSSGLLLTVTDKKSVTFSVTVETTASSLVYRWVDGDTGDPLSGADSSSSSYVYTHTASKDAKKILCRVYDGGNPDAKDWLCSAAWVIEGAPPEPSLLADETLPPVATGAWLGGLAAGVELGLAADDSPIVSAEIVSGALPAGVDVDIGLGWGVRFFGAPRTHGVYDFSLRIVLEDGDEATIPLTLTVTGEDIVAAAWYVDPVNGSYMNTGLSEKSAYPSVEHIGTRLLPGDTVVYLPGVQKDRFSPVTGVNYAAKGGEVVFAAGSGDTSVIACEPGASLAYAVGGLPWRFGEVVAVASVPDGAQAGDYTVRPQEGFAIHGAPYVEGGWLKVKALWSHDDHGRIVMRFAEGSADAGAKECAFTNVAIPKGAIFVNEGGANATIRLAGACECTSAALVFLKGENGVDLVLDDNATLVCHGDERIEGFDTMTFGEGSRLVLDNNSGQATLRRGVRPVFAGAPGSQTLELTRALEKGGWRGIVWEYGELPLDQFTLVVPESEQAADYQFQRLDRRLFVVRRDEEGFFPSLDKLCPPARVVSQSPAVPAASPTTPLVLTAGAPAVFGVDAEQAVAYGFIRIISERWLLDGEPLADADTDFGSCTFTPPVDLVDGELHRLTVVVRDQYHDFSDRADWYFTVVPPAPEVATVLRISAEKGAPIERDFAAFTTGGYGAYSFSFAQDKVPDGLSLTPDGVLSGVMAAALDDEDVRIAVTDEWGSRTEFTQHFHLRTSANEPPYLVSSTPAESEIAYEIGNTLFLEATAADDEGDSLEYRWLEDGKVVESMLVPGGSRRIVHDTDSAHETQVMTVACQVREKGEDDWTTVRVWTVEKVERPTRCSSQIFEPIPVGTQDVSLDLDCVTEQGHYIVKAEVIVGELPDGLEIPFNDPLHIVGEARKIGTYVFSVRFTSSNGQQTSGRFIVNVTGEADTEPRTWCVCSYDHWLSHPGMASANYTSFDDLVGLAGGDTVEVWADDDLLPLSDYQNRLGRSDVRFFFRSGNVRIERNYQRPVDLRHVGWQPGVTVEPVLLFDDYWGDAYPTFSTDYGNVVKVAKLPRGLPPDERPVVTSQFWQPTSSEYIFDGSPFLDADGDLCVRILGRRETNGSGSFADYVTLPDIAGRRDVVLKDWVDGETLTLSSAGVLPGSLTLEGDVSYAQIFGSDGIDADFRLRFDSSLNMELKPIDLGPGIGASCAMEIARGSRFVLSSHYLTDPRVLFFARSIVFTGEGDKTAIALPGALPPHSRVLFMQGYADDRDPNENMRIELPGDVADREAYHFTVEDGDVYLQNYADGEDEDHGPITWTDPDDLGEIGVGGTFKYSFGGTIPDYTSDPDIWSYYFGYQNLGKPFSVSRGETCTFDATLGEREMDQVLNVTGSATEEPSPKAVELGFGFPFAGRRAFTVTVEPNGILRIPVEAAHLQVLKDSQLTGLTQAYKHVYIARGDGTFTVRWGDFAMATLHRDGRIVIAYGPLADAGRRVGDAICPTLFQVSDENSFEVRFENRSGLYAGKEDAVLTPTGVLCTLFNGEPSIFPRGKVTVPGTYSVIVRAEAETNFVSIGQWTRTFTWRVTGEEQGFPTIKYAVPGAAVSEDGVIHLREGEEMPHLCAAADDGDAETKLTWHFDGSSSSRGEERDWQPDPPSRRRIIGNDGLSRIVLSARRGEYTTYRQWFVVCNQTFHVDASKAGESNQDGSAEHPWADFYHSNNSWSDAYMKMRYFGGDTIVVHPGTYRMPLNLLGFEGGVTITNAPGGSAANTVWAPTADGFNDADSDGRDYGRRAFTHATWELMELPTGWQYVRMPVTSSLVSGVTIRDSAICGDALSEGYTWNDQSHGGLQRYGVAGGGAFGGTFLNCVFENCAATNHGPWTVGETVQRTADGYGGAAYGADLVNCAIVGCRADVGGACSDCRLVNCTVLDNVAKVAAGGLDGECEAYNSIIRYNTCGGEASEYAATYRPSRLIADTPTIVDSFTSGDPLFCADYSLLPGSPCIDAGNPAHYPMDIVGGALDLAGKARFTTGRISQGAFEGVGSMKVWLQVETESVGAVSPNGCQVAVGGEQTFEAASDRPVVGWYTNGVLAASSGASFTWRDIPAGCSLKVVFKSKTLRVGPPKGKGAPYDFATVHEAVAAAGSGDVITVASGTYRWFDASGFKGALEVRAESYDEIAGDAAFRGAAGDVLIDGEGTNRCVNARPDDESVVLRGLVLTNGCTHAVDGFDEHGMIDLKGGGGLRGGRAENCTITGCRAYLLGGGSYRSTLVRCRIENNEAFRDDPHAKSYGGGAYGGRATECWLTGNLAPTHGAGTYNAIVKSSFAWGNYSSLNEPTNVKDGEEGASIYVVAKVPTDARVAAQPTKLVEPGEEEPVVFATEMAARSAAMVTGIDLPEEIIAAHVDATEYINRFEVQTVPNENGDGFVNTVDLKPEEVVKVQKQLNDAFTDLELLGSEGEQKLSPNQTMEKTLDSTTPGLYYALEFTEDLAKKPVGERHLATGKGSVRLQATSTDSPQGFWQLKAYLTPNGDK